MADTLRVEQIGIRAGNRQQRPPNIHVVDASTIKPWRSRGNLYILIEAALDSNVPLALYDELFGALTDAYYGTSGSVTRGLRSALLAANTLLYEQNMRTESEHRLALGITCVVARDADLYIGQLGPAMVSLVHEGQLVRYPSDSVWLRSASPSTLELNREPPVGLRKDVEPSLFHAALAPGDLCILSTTALARMSTLDDLLDAIAHAGSASVCANLELLANGRDLSCAVIAYQSDVPLAMPAGSAPRVATGSEQPRKAPLPPVEVPSAWPKVNAGAMPPEGLPLVDTTRPAMADEAATAHTNGLPTTAGVAEAQRSGEIRPPLADLSGLRDSLNQGAARIRQGAEDLMLRVLPESLPEPPAQRQEAAPLISLSGRALIAVALAIPLMMLFIIVMTRIQYERTRREQFGHLQALAQARYDAAMRQQDRAYVRQGLQEALIAVEEGLAIDPGDDALNSLTRRIRQKLDEIDAVVRQYHFWQLADLGEDVASPTDSSRIVIEGINVYVLNRGSDRLYRYLLNDVGDALQPLEGKPVLLQKGELRGGVRLGDLVDIAWLEAGGQRTASKFVALDRAGSLVVYDPQHGIEVLPVANSDAWLKPQAIGCYWGNLYVLDPLLARILKYVPVDNAYTSPPGDYMNYQTSIDLTGAVDMTIDGNLYVLFADGQIKKFFKGDPQPFSMAGLPSPMRNPTTLFVSGPKKPEGTGYVYVTDTGNERILQFDKAGNYVRQFQAKLGEPHLKKLRGLYVDEASLRMFVLSGRILWLTDLPRLGG